jgi:NADPH oxidase
MKLRQARNWCVNEAPFFILAVVFFGLQLATFAYQFNAILTDPSIKVVRSLLGLTLAVSRAAAYVLNWLCALILLPVLNKTLTRLRGASLGRFLYLERNIQVHIAFGWSIIWWVTVHVVGHFFNYLQLSVKLKIGTAEKALFFNYMDDFFKMGSPESYSLRTGPGVTGYVALIALFLMVTAAIPKVKEAKYEIFWIAHHLMVIFFPAMILHGQFCFIKSDPDSDVAECRGGPQSFTWLLAPGVIYLIERLARLIQARAYKAHITRIVQHPSKVVEVQFKKGGLHATPGQYILICCPSISSIQWHPFTLTSAPHEDYLSIHVDILGDWTREFAKRVGCDYGNSMNTKALSTEEMPLIRVVGGYGTPFVTKDVFKHDAVVLVGAGIGVVKSLLILDAMCLDLKNIMGISY